MLIFLLTWCLLSVLIVYGLCMLQCRHHGSVITFYLFIEQIKLDFYLGSLWSCTISHSCISWQHILLECMGWQDNRTAKITLRDVFAASVIMGNGMNKVSYTCAQAGTNCWILLRTLMILIQHEVNVFYPVNVWGSSQIFLHPICTWRKGTYKLVPFSHLIGFICVSIAPFLWCGRSLTQHTTIHLSVGC